MVAIFSLSGSDAGSLGDLVGGDTPETPEFEFEASKPKAVETSAKANHQAAVAAAQAPSEAVTQQLDDLYTAASSTRATGWTASTTTCWSSSPTTPATRPRPISRC